MLSDLSVPIMLFISHSINRLAGTDGFRVLCHQFFPSSLPRRAHCLNRFSTCKASEEPAEGSTPPMIVQRRPGSRNPAYGIPSSEWQIVLQRVLEKKEPLRTVAEDYGVSQETIRRLVRAAGRS